jgi:hypothetical protein
LLLLIFGTEFVAGIVLLADSHLSTPVELINYAVASSLLVGVARAWELVGARDTGIIASLVVLSRHAANPAHAGGGGAAGIGVADVGAAGHEHGDNEPGARPG